MPVTKDQVVAMHYVLKDDDGNIIDKSGDGQPLHYLHGHKNIVPGLEEALEGADPGDERKVTVPPEKGYGTRREEMVLDVPRSQLPSDLTPEVGMTLAMQTPDGHTIPVRVTKVKLDSVVLDANHELADATLHFEVKIDSVRKATGEELAHGHVHGPGGHHH